MSFNDIYNKIEELKELNIYSIIERESIDIVYDNDVVYGRNSRIMKYGNHTIVFIKQGLDEMLERNCLLHELGHYYFDKFCFCSNKRTEENNANLFMCLYLINNDIWASEHYQSYLISQGVHHKIASAVNDQIFQYKQSIIYKTNWLMREC